MNKWLCFRCYLWVCEPVWELGGDLEIKTIAPFHGQKCELFACSDKAKHLTSMPTDEFVQRLKESAT